MKTILTAVSLVALFPVDASANAGIFFGSGHTITLGKSEQVQLVSEDVTIKPNCSRYLPTDSVDYRCKFVLKNLTAKPLKIQVGFPLDSQFARKKEQPPTTDLVLDYGFIARDDKTTYHISFVPNDSEKKFSRLFLWDMAFDPAETKVLHVAYRLGMSQGYSSTRKDQETLPRYEKRWHAALELCFIESFYYVTETGKSWAGPIEHAKFTVETAGLEYCLKHRPMRNYDLPNPKTAQEEWEYATTIPMIGGAFYQSIEPDGGTFDGKTGTTTWEYRNYKPGEPLYFTYHFVAIPRTAADCESWVPYILGKKPSKADLAELREIAAAFYGIAPKSDSAQKFVKQQAWYHPKDGLQEAKLNEEQRAVLARLDAIAKAPLPPPPAR